MSAASEAFARLSMALLDVDPECQNDERFTTDDYSTTTVLKLAEICAVCPLFDYCEAFAQIDRPKAGIWAGRTYRTNQPRTTTRSQTS